MAIYTPSLSSDEEGRRLKLLYFSNEFPHDDLQDVFRRLRARSKDVQHPVLAHFIAAATRALREEVRRLPRQLAALLPAINTVLDLADHADLRKGTLCGAVDGVLLCVVELATLIGYYETRPHEFDHDSVRTCLAGLGMGLLASAAASLALTLANLPVIAAEVVRIAWRLGVVVHEVSQHLEPRDLSSSPDSWAYVIPEVAVEEVQKELNELQTLAKTPEASKVFISAWSTASVTVSGPPTRLKALFRNVAFFRDRKSVALPVYGGLCHARHVYTAQHVRSILDTEAMRALDQRFGPLIPVYSTSSGKPYVAPTAMALFEKILTEVLTQPIQWDNVVRGITEHASRIGASQCQVAVFRISLPIYDLISSMKVSLPSLTTVTEDVFQWLAREGAPESQIPRDTQHSKIAIIGMSCRMPAGATDTDRFWELLEQGMDVHRKVPADRFDIDSHHDPAGKRVNASHTAYGCFIDEPGLFDAPFFNMSPREAQQTDPMQRLALVTAYEALERAGYVANRTAASNLHRIGTFYGQASDDYREVNTAQEISTYFIPGGCRAFGPGRINYFFKFSGPSFSCDTACSSSLATIQAACTSLWNGETDMVVAGGMNVLTNSDAFAGLSHGHFLSKTPNACKTWDAEADGYCRADGVGSIVMKRLEDAEADNDRILGVICGAATNHSAEAVSITHPHAESQAYLFRQVMNRAAIDPLDVSYVEMHGTGTQAGDLVEIKSVSDVFAPSIKRRKADQPLYIGAAKSNVGHGEAAAGITALLKVLLMLQYEAIPPHVGIKTAINPGFPKDLELRNLRIPYAKKEWPHVPGKKRIAVVNNFSAAGGNTTVAIEEAPVRECEGLDPRSTHVITVSAKSKVSLKGNLDRMIVYLDHNPNVSLANLSYTTTARRYHHNHRVAIAASEVAPLRRQLVSYLSKVDAHKPVPATGSPDVVFAFTGQGASYKSMNLELFYESPVFNGHILFLDSLARGQGFPSFIPAVDGSHPQDYSHSPVITQLALVCTEIALAKYWASLGIEPNVVIGHSLGEYAALHVAGVLSASDTIFLVGQRARLLEERCRIGSHQMLAVRAGLPDIQAAASDLSFEVACVNGPSDTVLSGTREQIAAVIKPLEDRGFKCITLDVAFAFHSAQTDPVLDDFEAMAQSGVVFRGPSLPVISPLLGKMVFDEKTINANYMRRATRETVNFEAALRNAHKMNMVDDTTVWIEIGPHPVCMGFVKATITDTRVAVPSFRRGEDNWATLSQSLSTLHCTGLPVDWVEFHRPFEKDLCLLDLPTYAWNDKNYWIMYNGNWALTKGNTFYDKEKSNVSAQPISSLRTSLVHGLIAEEIHESRGRIVMQSDLMQEDFRAAAYGHNMNGCGVVTSSIHADIAYTLGDYLYKKLKPKAKIMGMNISSLEVLQGLVANKNPQSHQLIQVAAETADIDSGVVELKWYNVNPQGNIDEPFATALLQYGNPNDWLAAWQPLAHLIAGRIEDLDRLSREGGANRLSRNMAYQLFANNLVDYAEKYRGMQAVTLHGLEAYADVELTTAKGGTWTVPPFFIDSLAHLAGFIMNVSDAIDQKNSFCVTPGWKSMRFARPLVAGNKYRSYVKMIPTFADPSIFFGDVYILERGEIVGMVGGIKFRKYPRLLLDRFFSAPDEQPAAASNGKSIAPAIRSTASAPKAMAPAEPTTKSSATQLTETTPTAAPSHILARASSSPKAPVSVFTYAANPAAPSPPSHLPVTPTAAASSTSTAGKAIALIAEEAALDIDDLADEASFVSLGIDSLMSLVIAEKFREQLGVTVGGSLFLEYPTVGDLRSWLEEYYS